MSTLVTGAAGFIGSHLCERLLADGSDVVGLDSFDAFYDPAVKERNLAAACDHDRFRLVRGDVRDAEGLASLPDDIDCVVHLAARAAARPSLHTPAVYADLNVTGTARLLEWMAGRGVSRLVFASSSSVYGDLAEPPFEESRPVGHPRSPYGVSKRAGELLCHSVSAATGLTVAALRYFTVHGPRQRPDLAVHKFVRMLRDGGRIPLFGDGSSSRDYTYVDDIVSGTGAAVEWVRAHEGYRVFNLGNDRSVSLLEMAHTIADVMGVPAAIDHAPAHPVDLEHTRADIRRARAELGYDPKTDFRTGVERFIEWLDAIGG